MSVFHSILDMDYYGEADTQLGHVDKSCEHFVPEHEKASIFIPYLHPSLFLPEEDSDAIQKNIVNILNGVGLFNIKRIDIAQNTKTPKMMAFVHFHFWQKNNTVDCIRNIIDMCGFYQINLNIISQNFPGGGGEGGYGYIRLYYNKNPIPEIKTELNNIQLAAALADVDKKLKEYEITISTQRVKIDNLTVENNQHLDENFQLALSLGESEQQVVQLKEQLRFQKFQYNTVYAMYMDTQSQLALDVSKANGYWKGHLNKIEPLVTNHDDEYVRQDSLLYSIV